MEITTLSQPDKAIDCLVFDQLTNREMGELVTTLSWAVRHSYPGDNNVNYIAINKNYNAANCVVVCLAENGVSTYALTPFGEMNWALTMTQFKELMAAGIVTAKIVDRITEVNQYDKANFTEAYQVTEVVYNNVEARVGWTNIVVSVTDVSETTGIASPICRMWDELEIWARKNRYSNFRKAIAEKDCDLAIDILVEAAQYRSGTSTTNAWIDLDTIE